MADLGHLQIADAIIYLTTQLTAGNPFVVLGPSLDNDDYTPAEGIGIIINGVDAGAAGFPVEPGHAYTFSLDINNIFQVMGEENTDGLWYRVWDNVGEAWLSWSLFNDRSGLVIIESVQVGSSRINKTEVTQNDNRGVVQLGGIIFDGDTLRIASDKGAYVYLVGVIDQTGVSVLMNGTSEPVTDIHFIHTPSGGHWDINNDTGSAFSLGITMHVAP